MNIIEKARIFANECLEGLDSAHGIKHAEITADFARIIAEKENADAELCVVTALLHDISRNKDGKWKQETAEDNLGVDGAKKARGFLISLGCLRRRLKIYAPRFPSIVFQASRQARFLKFYGMRIS